MTATPSIIDIVGVDPLQPKAPTKPLKGKPGRPRTKPTPPVASSSASASGSRTPVGEDWILDCEICHRTGVNKVNRCAKLSQSRGFAHNFELQDDGSPLLCCGKCSKWQHIVCHDLADRQAGRPKRNWDTEEFICRACQVRTLANGKQVPNGSSYDSGRTPSPYYHQPAGYAGQAPYGQNYTPHPHHAQSPYPQHTAITFSHYQPQHRGFTNTLSSPHAQATSQGPSSYPQPHYTTHSSPSKLAQYSAPQASVISMYSVR